ncbi:MAG: TIGR00341 family protein [Novosphingobium meiothermophilum]
MATKASEKPEGSANRQSHGRAALLASIARSSRLTPTYLMLVALATALAHVGLLMDSPPVIIGAMLISPLLGPIMGFGFGVAIFELALLRRAAKALGAGMVLAVVIAIVLTWLSPIQDVTPSILARVRPNLLDLLVAVFGGIAGAYATVRREAISLVGVAIATALVPPLAVVGFSIATLRFDYAWGALLLFITNATAIALMATVTARLRGFGTQLSPRQSWAQTIGIFATLVALAIPLGLRLAANVTEARAQSAITRQLQELAGSGARIDRLDTNLAVTPAQIDAVVMAPRYNEGLQDRFADRVEGLLGREVNVRLVQIRSGTPEAEDARRALEDAIATDRTRKEEVTRLRATLARLVEGDSGSVLVDAERRSAWVFSASPLPPATLPALEIAFPGWSISWSEATPPMPASTASAP